MKALFIGPRFYGYEIEICKALNSRGYEVDYYPERNDFFNSFIHFISKFIRGAVKLNKLYEKYILKEINPKQYDLFLLIRGENFTYNFTKEIICHHMTSNGQTVYYTWDSINNLPNARFIYPLFQRSYTFDLNDSKTFNGLSFLPLFYIDAYHILKNNASCEWDICIIASYSRERCEYVRTFIDKGYTVFYNLYISPYLYIKQLLFNPEFRKYDKKFISMTKLSHEEIINIYDKTRAVLDIPNRMQSGLSMRTLECLGCGKKMITTNQEVIQYDFYNEHNIFLINANSVNGIKQWLLQEYVVLKQEIVKKYSIDRWLDTLIYSNVECVVHEK